MSDITSIILENEGLIYKIASYFPYQDKDDLYQAGCKGILLAYQNYDESKGAKFSSYAYTYILGEMKSVVRENRSLKIGRDISKLNNQIERAKTILEQKLMHEPSALEISQYLEIPESLVEMALNSKVKMQSIDDMVGDTNMMLHEIISSPDVDVDSLLFLKMELDSLGEPERTIMIERYYEDMTQLEVARGLGLSQVDVSRREKKVLMKLRSKLTFDNN